MDAIGQAAALTGAAWIEEQLKRRKEYERALAALGLTIQDAWKAASGLNTTTGADGGYLVPGQHVGTLLQAIDGRSIVRPRAQVLTGVSPNLTIPTFDHDTNGTRSGVAITWGNEGAAISRVDPDLGRVSPVPRKLVALFVATNELLQDSNAAQALGTLAADAVANFLDQHYLAGSGVGQPLGALNAPCAVKVTRQTGSQIGKADIGKMVSYMLPQSIGTVYSPNPGLVWMAHPSTAEYLYQHMEILYTMGMLGSPLVYSEHMSALGTEGDIALIDWSYYLCTITQQFAVARSRETPEVFQTDETAFRITMRGDGMPWMNAPITLVNGSHQVSPIVILSDAA
jgi:HK97 family phage major capsid protein